MVAITKQTRETMAKSRIIEFDWLKMAALLLLIFVHTNLYFDFPNVMQPVEWVMLSIFFFVSGFLAFDSFHKRGTRIRDFLKSKVLSLYVPFIVAAVLYFLVETAARMPNTEPVGLVFQASLFNVFDVVNSGLYNWSFLWFVPYLLIFMLILCFLEKYIENAKYQVFAVSVLWLCTILAWVFYLPERLGLLFSQYFLVFMIGFWLNKLKLYDRIVNFRTAYIAIPLIAVFSFNFSNIFTLNNPVNTLNYLLYYTGRSMLLSLSVILLVLLLLRKINVPRNHFVELITELSIFIYLLDPFLAYIVMFYIFGQSTINYFASPVFYIYQAIRVAVLFAVFPILVKTLRTINQNHHQG